MRKLWSNWSRLATLIAMSLTSLSSMAQMAPTRDSAGSNRPEDPSEVPEEPPRQSAADSAPASEAEPAVAEPAVVVPPKPLSMPVDYPDGAEGSAIVVLQFVVNTDGLVEDIQVQQGDEPFASAAASAAAGWRFVPALRGGKTAPARIQLDVVFEPPVQTPAPTDSQGTETGAEALLEPGSAKASIQTSFEVVIEGERPPASVTFSRAEARQIPGAFGDPFRAVEAMPGVSPIISGLPLFYVRGAPPGNVGQYIDEVQIPFLYHVFLFSSVVHPMLLDKIHLYQGPYPANYGRHAGAVIAADLRRPLRERSYGFSVGIFDAGVYGETPFANDRGSVFVAGRYSYTGALASAVTGNGLEFWNYQALAEYELTDADVLSVFVLGAYDSLAAKEEEEDGFFGREFHRADVRLDHSFSEDTSARVGLTLGIGHTPWQSAKLSNQTIAGRLRLRHRLSDTLLLKTGLSGALDQFGLDLGSRAHEFHDVRELFGTHQARVGGGFTELEWRATPAVTLTPGIRVDLFDSGADSAVGVDPRLTARFRLTDKVNTIYGIGVSHQPPTYIPEVPGARVAGLPGGLQRAVHTTAGVETELPYDVNGSLALFNNAIIDVTDPFSATQDAKLRAEVAMQRPLAHSYGAELSLKRPLTRRLGAMLNYTFSRTTRTHDEYKTLSGADRTHVLNLAGLYTLGANWRLGGRSVFYTGIPGGRLAGKRRIFDQSRAHPFFRLDVQLERRFRIGERSYWSVTAEILNATAGTETLRRVCSASGCEDVEVGPVILPNLRIEGHF